MTTEHPYFHRRAPSPGRPSSAFASCGDHVDLSSAHLLPYPGGDALPAAADLFDARAAACISAAVGMSGTAALGPVRVWPLIEWTPNTKVYAVIGGREIEVGKVPDYPLQTYRYTFDLPSGSAVPRDLLEMKYYPSDSPPFTPIAPTIYLPTSKCLGALAYADFFPDQPSVGFGLRSLVSAAVCAAAPGWCGTFGPGADGTFDVTKSEPPEGNYDMSQMHLLGMAYQYYDSLSPDARDHLITELLAAGCIHRPDSDDIFTSGVAPNDWARAGHVSPLGYEIDIGETENHILMIAATRYLTNQLLYQRDHLAQHDNRRNGGDDFPSSMSLVLSLLRNILRDDFSEYNAKPYQEETRRSLLNLCTYAYDYEVRLAAQMVLDYVAAHIVVSSNDCRRMVPFRRRNEDVNQGHWAAHGPDGNMVVALLDGLPPDHSCDPMTTTFAIQAGTTRMYEGSAPWPWGIPGDGTGMTQEVLSSYRLPPSIHDLFVTDMHRRFFQRLHRTRWTEVGGNHNADNMEIYASSPSYLITAGGQPDTWAVDPRVEGIVVGDQDIQLGVAVPTSFMATGVGGSGNDLVQLGRFGPEHVDRAFETVVELGAGLTELAGRLPENYGVAPDFACGYGVHLPAWLLQLPCEDIGAWRFWDVSHSNWGQGPGFYLAIYQDTGYEGAEFGLLEAYDTWLHPELRYEEFHEGVISRNGFLNLTGGLFEFDYTTTNGNRLSVSLTPLRTVIKGIAYSGNDPTDAEGDAGNITTPFLNGTIMNSPGEAVVEIRNPWLGTGLTLDMRDEWHPRRTDETGNVEEAGGNHELWLDFDWTESSEGDVCRPYSSIEAASEAVANRGTIRIIPSTTTRRPTIGGEKRFRLLAPSGGVLIGARDPTERLPIEGTLERAEPVGKSDVWVQFDFPASSKGNIAGPCNNLADAERLVKEENVIRIVPGVTSDRPTLGNGKRFRLAGPVGGVIIGALPVAPVAPQEVWVNFGWTGAGDGTPCNPFTTIAQASEAVAPSGTIDVVAGRTADRATIGGGKHFRLLSRKGQVTVGG